MRTVQEKNPGYIQTLNNIKLHDQFHANILLSSNSATTIQHLNQCYELDYLEDIVHSRMTLEH
jgi:hypothetical protein